MTKGQATTYEERSSSLPTRTGEIPPGYKRTEVGVIPEEWEVATLFKLAGESKSRFDDGDWVEAEFLTTSGVRLLQTGNIGIGEFIDKETKKYISDVSFDVLRCKEVIPGDLLICRLADPAGRACIAPSLAESKLITSVDVTIFRPLPGIANPVYLLQVFGTRRWFSEVSDRCGGSTRSRIARGQLAKISVQLPPLPEQRSIAEALSDVDRLIGALEKLIAKKRAIKLAAMQQLLTSKTRLPRFRKEWQPKRLGSILTVRHGRSQRDVAVPDGKYPILASGGEIGRSDDFLYDKPSVLIGRKGTIDEPQFVSSPFWTVDTLFYTEIDGKHSPKFLFYKFCMIPWQSYNEASGVPSLNARTIESIEINVPMAEEQTAIAAVLSAQDAEIAALERQRSKTRDIKQGMMQQLLTGRVRLVKPKGAEANV